MLGRTEIAVRSKARELAGAFRSAKRRSAADEAARYGDHYRYHDGDGQPIRDTFELNEWIQRLSARIDAAAAEVKRTASAARTRRVPPTHDRAAMAANQGLHALRPEIRQQGAIVTAYHRQLAPYKRDEEEFARWERVFFGTE
jgi:hypothetical protein